MDRDFFYAFMQGEGGKDYELYLNTKALLSCQKDYHQLANHDELLKGRASVRHVASTASCSMPVVRMCRRPDAPRAAAAPRSAMLSDSVPHAVNTISDGAQCRARATASREDSTAASARCP